MEKLLPKLQNWWHSDCLPEELVIHRGEESVPIGVLFEGAGSQHLPVFNLFFSTYEQFTLLQEPLGQCLTRCLLYAKRLGDFPFEGGTLAEYSRVVDRETLKSLLNKINAT